MASLSGLSLVGMAKGGGGGTPGGGRGFWIGLGVAVVVLAGAVTAYNAGLFGSGGDPCESVTNRVIHEHAELFVYLDTPQPWDFSPQRYQVAARFIHFEDGPADANGATIHIHQVRPTLGCLFKTLNWDVSEDEIRTDTGQKFRVAGGATLEILFNGEPAKDGFDTLLRGQVKACDAPGECPTYSVQFRSGSGDEEEPADTNGSTEA